VSPRVAFLLPERLTFPALSGGAFQVWLEALLPHLGDLDLRIIATAADGASHPEVSYVRESAVLAKVRPLLVRIPKAGARVDVAWTQRHYLRAALDHLEGVDVVYVFNRAQFVAAIRSRFPRVKIVLRMGNLHLRPERGLREADLVDCCSEFVKREITRAVPGIRRTSVTPETVSLPEQPRPEEERALAAGPLRILFVGRLVPEKGAHLLVEAVKLLRSTGRLPDLRVVVVGSAAFGSNRDSSYSMALRQSAREVADVVEFAGFVAPAELDQYYRSADVFVGPSMWFEPAGRTFAEAMAYGLPVISTDIGGIPETVSAAGAGILLAPPPRAEGLAEAILTVVGSPDLASAQGQAGREFVEEHLEASVVADQVRRIVRSV